VPLLGWDPPPLSHNVFAGDFMSYPVIKLNCIESVARIVDVLRNENYNGFPVVTSVYRSDVRKKTLVKMRHVLNFNYEGEWRLWKQFVWIDAAISAHCSPPKQNFCGNQGRVDEEICLS
jgi:hypothetical protein